MIRRGIPCMELKIIKVWPRFLLKKLYFFLLGLISFAMDNDSGLKQRKRERKSEEKPSLTKQDESNRGKFENTALETGSYWLTRIVFLRFLGFIYCK